MSNKNREYDVIVVGGGHAGIEAAAAASRMGCKTAMVTLRAGEIGQMSCNPAIGGLAKGQLAREVDALGGLMGRIIDEAGIQFRMLNTRKGPAVQSPRAQADRKRYKSVATRLVMELDNLDVIEDEVIGILTESSSSKTILTGLKTKKSGDIFSKAVILTTGTFLKALMHFGMDTETGGRMGSPAALTLSDSLKELGIELGRLKTGTPPRINGKTVDFSQFEAQNGDEPPPNFSFWGEISPNNVATCHLGHTNSTTHGIIRDNLDRSPLYTGKIRARGPRYCPSIEDKVVKFNHHPRHYVFLEPEGLDTDELYVNGIATSLPPDVQDKFVSSIKGLENMKITKYGYSVEYDYVPPYEMRPTLESRKVGGLYFAGQINGTSGYEEAAALGLSAGINAASKIMNLPPFILRRDQAYIGVLIDDLATKSTDEPYRMFTSRAEYRLLLRQDNAHLRLWRISKEYNLLPVDIINRFKDEECARDEIIGNLRSMRLSVNEDMKNICNKIGTNVPNPGISAAEFLRRPHVGIVNLYDLGLEKVKSADIERQVEIEIKYEGYFARQKETIDKSMKQEETKIPENIDYNLVTNMTLEAREKMTKFRPITIGQARRLSGISPSDIACLLIYLRTVNRERENTPNQV